MLKIERMAIEKNRLEKELTRKVDSFITVRFAKVHANQPGVFEISFNGHVVLVMGYDVTRDLANVLTVMLEEES